MMCAAVLVAGAVALAAEKTLSRETTTGSQAGWKTFTDAQRHFHFEHPAAWKVSAEPLIVMHYGQVFCALNSLGKDRFAIREHQTATNTWEFGMQVVTNQLPPGTAYLDIWWWEGPAPRFGPNVHEMTGRDLSGVLESAKATEGPELVQREVELSKWGRRWSIVSNLHPPVSVESRKAMERALASFRYDGVAAGDPVWAIGEAREKLPAEADSDRFER